MTDALDAARLAERAAEGDERAQERLADLYRELIRAISEDLNPGESDTAEVVQVSWPMLLEGARRIERAGTGERLLAGEGTQPPGDPAAGDLLSALPPHWQQLLQLLMPAEKGK